MPQQSTLPSRGEALCLLSLDAGGARAISQLEILAKVMRKLNSESPNEDPKRPCDVFSMIGGTGTGGLIAILLVVFGLSAEQASQEFVELNNNVFEAQGIDSTERTDLLKIYLDEILTKHGLNKNTKILEPNSRSNGCKLVVPISYKKHVGSPSILRNFSVRQEQALDLTVVEALLVTLATPPLFDSISIFKDASNFEYISGDLLISNPTRKIIAEAQATFGSERLVACLVNLGCGHPGVIATPEDSTLANWKQFLEKLVADNERTAQEIQAQMDHLGIFHRFSVTLGLEGRPRDAALGVSDIVTHTETYLADGAVVEKMEACIDALKTHLGISSLEQLNRSGGGIIASPTLPLLTNTFVMRKEPWRFIERIMLGTPGGSQAASQRMLAVTGMGGCGKTQLILKFLLEHADRFSLQIFIDGSSEAQIRSEIVRHIRSLGPEHSQKTFSDCLDFLGRPSPNGRRVIIYDNVDDPTLDLRPLLPKGDGCDIVITSRNHSIGEFDPNSHLELDAMPMDEAMELLFLPPNRSLHSREDAREIANLLGCLPIALTQARSYMYQTQCSGSEYLEILHEARAELLAEPMIHQRDMRYLSTDAAFDASFKQLAERNQQALFLLSNLHWTNIPLYLVVLAAKYKFTEYELTYIEHGDEYHTGKAVLENLFLQNGRFHITAFNRSMVSLQNYSLVTVAPGVDTRLLHMHPLVHAWLEFRIPEGERLKYQSAAVVLLALGARMMHTPLVQYLPSHVTHLASLWNRLHANEAMAFGLIMHRGGHFNDALLLQERVVARLRAQLNPDNSALSRSIGMLASTYGELGRMEDAKMLQEEVLRMRKQILGEQHQDTITASSNLASTYRNLGRMEDAKALREEVLRLSKDILGRRHPDTITASSNLAITYGDLGKLEDSRALMEEAFQLQKEILGERHPNTIIISNNLANTYRNLGRLEEAKVLMEEAVHLQKEILGERHPDTISTSNNLAITYRSLGRLADAKEIQEEGLRLRKDALGERHPDTITASNNLASTYRDLGRVEDAKALMEEGLRLQKEILGERHPSTITAASNLAITYGVLGRLWDEKGLEEDVLRLRKEVLGERHHDTITASNNLASTYRALGRMNDTMELMEEVLRLQKETLGERHPNTITASGNLAITYRELGRLEDARVLREELLRLQKEVLGERHPSTINATINLAVAYRDLGRLEDTKALREEVLRLQKETLGERHPNTITASSYLAITYSDLGRPEDAKTLRESVLQLQKEILGERHPDTITASNNLASTYRDLGRLEDAKDLIEEVLRLQKEVLGERHINTITASNNLGIIYRVLGRLEEAKVLQEEVLRLRKEILGEWHPDTIAASSNLTYTIGKLAMEATQPNQSSSS